MEIHAVGAKIQEQMLNRLKEAHVKRVPVEQFKDPIREFHRASQIVGTVANWRTLPVEDRKRIVKQMFGPIYQRPGEPNHDPPIMPESDAAFKDRCLERWRGLCVIIQEESRLEVKTGRCSEVAASAFALLFPEHPLLKAPAAPQGK